MTKVSVIIPNYNTKDILHECLQNLFSIGKNLKEITFEIIVVDIASVDGSVEMVEQEFKDVILIASSENKGLAYANNLGLEKSTSNYLLYLGTDAFPSEETIEGMVSYMEKNPNVGISTPKLLLRSGLPDMDAHRGFPTPWASFTHFTKLNKLFPKSKIFNKYFLGWESLHTPHEIDLCISHFMLIQKKVFEKIGKWDEDFFVFGEDVDLCYRTKKAGFKIMYLGQFTALHYKGVSVGRKESSDIKTISNQSSQTRKRMRSETTRAMRLFYNKHYKDKYHPLVTAATLAAVSLLERIRNLRV